MNARTDTDPRDNEIGQLRVPPHSVEAEQSVLGGLLLDNRAWDRVADLLNQGDFYRYEHQLIYTAMSKMLSGGKPADVVTVFERMQSLGKAEDAGGLSYLNALAQSVPSAANMRRYAEIVREKSVLRSIISFSSAAADEAWNSIDVSATLDRVAALCGNLERHHVRQEAQPLSNLVPAALERINARAEGRQTPGIPTGIKPLDRLINGLGPGKLIGLAARPSIGKSSASRGIGLHASRLGHKTLLLSQEMPQEEVVDCVLAGLASVDSQHIQTGKLGRDEWSALVEATETASTLPFYIDDQGSLSLADIRAKARTIKGLQLLILDYLQLSRSTLKGATTNDQVAEISKGLKALAMELKIPVLVLSQLNRDVEKRVDREPQLSDLRDSGAIEQDLDIAILLWTVPEFDDGARRIVGWKVAKHRGGPKGAFGMEFDAPRYRWSESAADIRPPKSSRRDDL